MSRIFAAAAVVLGLLPGLRSADAPVKDERYPYRTDATNAHLPWHRPKPGEFPPLESAHRIDGELVAADFVHRTGQFRARATGELTDFTLPPYGVVGYLTTDGDLRDVPIGTFCQFFLHPDSAGEFTRLATMRDDVSADAAEGIVYRLDAKPGAGKLVTTRRGKADLGKVELAVTDKTRIWKGEKPAILADLAAGDELLINRTGVSATDPGRCTDVWAGTLARRLAAEKQRQRHSAFLKDRGLAGRVEKTEGQTLAVTLFAGDRAAFEKAWPKDFAAGRDVHVVVANDELRTWNPPVDQEAAKVVEVQKIAADAYGHSGVRLVLAVRHMLEGFRRGRVVRVFGAGWKTKDQPYGESLMGYGYERLRTPELVELPPKEYPDQFPFRTDWGNAHLPWYRLKPGVAPPLFAEHRAFGELVSVDPESRTGRFRADRTGTSVDFALIPDGSVRVRNAAAGLADLPLGIRCRFHLYRDEKGAFARAGLVTDEFSYLAANAVTWRVERLDRDRGELFVARQIPPVKDSNDDISQPPDPGAAVLRVSAETRVWKGEREVKLEDLTVGDALFVDLTGERPGHPSRCTDLWVGAATHKLVAERQAKKAPAPKR